MSSASASRTWAQLVAAVDEVPARFVPATTADLPEPAQRLLDHALPAGVRLSTATELRMEGEIRLGRRWMPFRAEQILRAGAGFVWRPVVGGRVMRFVGADELGPDGAGMEFRFQGIVPVARASGPDTARSAAGRLAAETVAWLPQALTPQVGARWSPLDDRRAVVTLEAGSETVDVEVRVDAEGRLESLCLQRWNDAAKPPAFEPFGGRVEGEHLTEDGVRIAGSGSVGWGWGTAEAVRGVFFRYSVIAATPLPGVPRPPSAST